VESIDNIIKGCLKGRRKAQKQLYELYSAKMYGVCFRYARNREDAEDILQEGFMIVFDKLHTFKKKGSFEGWIKRIIINTAIRKYRENISNLAAGNMYDHYGFLEQMDNSDQMSLNELLEIIQSLPAQYRIVFNMYVIEGYSHKEISNTLKISENTSRSNYARARYMLMEKLQNENVVAGLSKALVK